jgi:hypothetical protein
MRTNRSGESALLLLDVVDLLAVQKIEYAVIGALAASVHGAVRASMDADVVLSIGMGEAKDFVAMKVFAGGPMDLIDASRAVSAGGASLDFKLTRRLAARYGREALESLERILAG